MSEIRVKEHESLDNALKRFKRCCVKMFPLKTKPIGIISQMD